MNTTQRFGCRHAALLPVRRLLPVLAALVISPVVAAESSSVEPKTHTLFMGADLSIEQNHQLYRVQAIAGTSFVITVDGREVRVPVNQPGLALKLDSALKLTETSAAVAQLKAERAFTLANDPTVRFQKGLAASQQMYADSQYTQHAAEIALAQAQSISTDPAGAHPVASRAQLEDQKATAVAATQAALNQASAAPGSGPLAAGAPVGMAEAFDAMEIRFEVSAERTLEHPYVVIVARFRPPGARPDQVANWIYAKALPPVTRESQKVHLLQGGFPPGFELLDSQVRLYNRGEEIATDVAPKRVLLTRDEAFLYVKSEYLSRHRDATVPPTPALGRLPADWATRLASGQFKQVYYIAVNKDGKTTGIFADKSCSQKVADPYLESALRNFRFNPALEKGKPVDGVAAVNFAELAI